MKLKFTKIESNGDINISLDGTSYISYSVDFLKNNDIELPTDQDFSKITIKGKSNILKNLDVVKSLEINNNYSKYLDETAISNATSLVTYQGCVGAIENNCTYKIFLIVSYLSKDYILFETAKSSCPDGISDSAGNGIIYGDKIQLGFVDGYDTINRKRIKIFRSRIKINDIFVPIEFSRPYGYKGPDFLMYDALDHPGMPGYNEEEAKDLVHAIPKYFYIEKC